MAENEKAASSASADKKAKSAGLNLEQKFVKLREAVPAIVQKQHSDGVKYKFAKIFDVYQLLAPAMNEWGVNFDVVGEEATRRYENGDPKYFDSYQQQTRNGPRTVWIYEADITVRWTNADSPTETREITLHALGTNDGGPDKAKGSAWTYCIKYYLFEKFSIDQGEDDPDNYDHGDEPTGGKETRPAGGNKGGNGPRSLSDPQVERLYKKAEAANFSRQRIDARIKEKYGCQRPHDLKRDQYDEICASLDEAAAQQKKEGGPANA